MTRMPRARDNALLLSPAAPCYVPVLCSAWRVFPPASPPHTAVCHLRFALRHPTTLTSTCHPSADPSQAFGDQELPKLDIASLVHNWQRASDEMCGGQAIVRLCE